MAAGFTTEGLDRLIKSLKKPPKARVGILGKDGVRNAETEKAVRSGIHGAKLTAIKVATQNSSGTQSNAEIGAAHEFGTSKLPVRSFLRIPIAENLEKYLEKAGLLDKKVIDDAIKTGSALKLIKQIAIVAETIVLDAFETGGFGKWKKSKMKNKKNQQTLVETQQLRNSITSVVASGD